MIHLALLPQIGNHARKQIRTALRVFYHPPPAAEPYPFTVGVPCTVLYIVGICPAIGNLLIAFQKHVFIIGMDQAAPEGGCILHDFPRQAELLHHGW